MNGTEKITQSQLRELLATGERAAKRVFAAAKVTRQAEIAAISTETGLPAAKGRKRYQAKREPVATQQRASVDNFRFVIGIDPGVKTGFAVWNRAEKELHTVSTMDFWDVVFALTRSNVYKPESAVLVIEIAHYAPTFRQRRGKAQSVGTMDRMARNVGGVTREAQLLVEGLRRFGYQVIESRPIGKIKKNGEYSAEEDRRQFERVTEWTEQTSQHARDAARLCYGM